MGDTQMVQAQNLCDYLKPETAAGEGLVKEAYSEQGRRFSFLLTRTEVLK